MTRVGIVPYPEGQGHATRMLSIATALEDRDADVVVAAGGPGTAFIEAHGHDVYHTPPVDLMGDDGDYDSLELLSILLGSVPRGYRRISDLAGWMRRTGPDAIVTDDMFAVAAATVTRTPFYVVSHNSPSLYSTLLDRRITRGINRYQQTVGEAFFYPAVWSPMDEDPSGVRRIPPLALEGRESDDKPAETDVLLVPSTFSEGYDDLAAMLRDRGYRVTHVGDEDWEPVPALLPWIRATDVVVCTGYSTVMEAAVAGTPCVVWPFTDEQRSTAHKIERTGVRGFAVEHSTPHVLRAVESPPGAPDHRNGNEVVADAVLDAVGTSDHGKTREAERTPSRDA